jgi:hypothetical protein
MHAMRRLSLIDGGEVKILGGNIDYGLIKKA